MTINVKIENQDSEQGSKHDGKQRIVKVSASDNDGAPYEIDRLYPKSTTSQHIHKGRRLVIEEIEIDAPQTPEQVEATKAG